MIVAVGDFNMGAMENKGLNIFNTKYVLARADTATDADYREHRPRRRPRVFPQLDRQPRHLPRLVPALAQGRPDRLPRPGVRRRRALARRRRASATCAACAPRQFPEDAGPMAHPIRPASYVEINNFYTATVYEKGAEVVRMIQTLIGRDAFRKGMDLYFRAPRRPGRHLRGFRRRHGRRLGLRPHPVHALVQPGRHAACRGLTAISMPKPERYTLTCTQVQPGAPATMRPYLIPVRGRAVHRTRRVDRRQRAPAATHRQHAVLRLRRRRCRARPVAAARLLGAGDPRFRLHAGASSPSAGPRQRPVQPLGSRPAPGLDADPRRRGGHRCRPVAGVAGQLRRCRPPPAADAGRARRRLRRRSADAARRRHAGRSDGRRSTRTPCTPRATPCAAISPSSSKAEFSGLYAALAPSEPYAPTSAQAGRRALRNVCLGYLLELRHRGHPPARARSVRAAPTT